ncbi:MAG: tRNA (guanine-N(7)-)-methyltransferase [Acidobacteriota bacterium]|nr:tRNA (guanine-N(7)-)-methyltransferase [Acidobacteriota bacterium]
MIQRARVSVAAGDHALDELPAPLPLDRLIPGRQMWEVEIGFGKGRYLLRRCLESRERGFAGIELVAEYHRLFVGRARRRGAANWVAVRGEALYLLAAVLPRGFAAAVHVYFPDPWPKSRHHKRRLFDPETVDLVLGLLAPGGRLFFATDFLDYGELVLALLASCPGLAVTRREAPWSDGPRTNYEAKYMAMGRPILRLEAVLAERAALHPDGSAGILAAFAPPAPALPSPDTA